MTNRIVILSCILLILGIGMAVGAENSSKANLSKLDPRLLGFLDGTTVQQSAFSAPSSLKKNINGEILNEVIVFTQNPSEAQMIGITPSWIGEKMFAAYVSPIQLKQLSNLGDVTYIQSPRYYSPKLDKSVVEMKADKLQSGIAFGTQYRGKGVIVGVLDSGIDWRHFDFRSPTDTTKSRILFMLDLTTGAEYTNAQINSELAGTTSGVVQETDLIGHGTHVAGIAAGNGSSSKAGFIGVAPEADLIIVKGGDNNFSTTNILKGISYIRQKADSIGEPFVINLSLGGHDGSHDGTSAEEVQIDNELNGKTGRAIVIAAGNEGSDKIHTDGILAQGTSKTFQCTVPSYTPTAGTQNDAFFLTMWYNAGDQLSISVQSPNGSAVTALAGQHTQQQTVSGDGCVDIVNAVGGVNPVNGANECEVVIFDLTATAPPRPGVWTVTVTATNITRSGSFDCWLSNSTMGGVEMTGNATFTKLVGMPGTSKKAITVGSYVSKWSWKAVNGLTYAYNGTDRTNNYSLFSSMGPTRDGRVKPDISAPGQAIASALSTQSTVADNIRMPDGVHFIEQGTSMASPHITGLVALMLQAKPLTTPDKIKSSIVSSGRLDSYTGAVPNVQWGYGKIDAVSAFGTILTVERISGLHASNFVLDQNYPNPFNPSTEIQFSVGHETHVTLVVYDILGRNVKTLVNENLQAGSYLTHFNGSGLSSGVYYYTLRAGSMTLSKKMLLMQ